MNSPKIYTPDEIHQLESTAAQAEGLRGALESLVRSKEAGERILMSQWACGRAALAASPASPNPLQARCEELEGALREILRDEKHQDGGTILPSRIRDEIRTLLNPAKADKGGES